MDTCGLRISVGGLRGGGGTGDEGKMGIEGGVGVVE